jgi:hypothetical protein
MVRVTRRRIALGLLNRHSLLYWQKGRQGGRVVARHVEEAVPQNLFFGGVLLVAGDIA